MPWHRERAYLEQLAADPYQPPGPVWMVDPEQLPKPQPVPESEEVARYGATLDSLAGLGFTTRVVRRPPPQEPRERGDDGF